MSTLNFIIWASTKSGKAIDSKMRADRPQTILFADKIASNGGEYIGSKTKTVKANCAERNQISSRYAGLFDRHKK